MPKYPTEETETVAPLANEASPSEGMVLVLEIEAGHPRKAPLSLAEGSAIIGRQPDVDLQLLADGVSRRHAKIISEGRSRFRLVDLGSKNGTLLNGQPIESEMLGHGDTLTIGVVELRVVLESSRPGTKRDAIAAILSARELEVTELVAQGLTNVEIGKRLAISRRTVAAHLEKIYKRLGVHSRTALASKLLGGPSAD